MIKFKNFTDSEVQYVIDNYDKMTTQQIADNLSKNINGVKNVVHRLGLIKQSHKHWTKQEDDYLKENYLTMSSEEIGNILHRTIHSVNTRCATLNLVKHDNWTNDEIQYLQDNYLELEHATIGNILGRSEGAVRAKCFDLNLYKKETPWEEWELDFVKHNYMEMTTKEISEILQRTTNAIKIKAQRMGMKKYPYHCNYHFFENIDTEEKAYWLGFITADGWVGKCENTNSGAVGIELQYGDIKHLKKFNIAIDGNYKITDRWRHCSLSKNPNQLSHFCCIRIFSIAMYNDLSKYGISDNKTYNVPFQNLRPDLIRHYIRGLFDADGCFCLSNQSFGVSYITASKSLKDGLMKCITEQHINIYDYDSIDEFGTRMYRPTINKNSDKIKFLDWIYKDASIYLDRKYKKYLKAKEKYEPLNGLAA